IQRFSMSLYLLDMTNSSTIFANILAISILPQVLLAPIAGVLADRKNKKMIMLILDFISFFVLTIYAIIIYKNLDNYFIVASVMVILSTCQTIYQPAVTASIPIIVKENKLVQANGLVQQVSSINNFLAPILAGIVYGIFGIKIIIIINAISFIISYAMECFLDDLYSNSNETGKINLKVFFKDMHSGYTYLSKKNKIIFKMILTSGLYNLFLVPIFSIIAPYIIKLELNMSSQTYGISEGIIAFGMIMGGFLITLNPKMLGIKKIYYALYPNVVALFLASIIFMGSFSNKIKLVTFVFAGFIIMFGLGIANVISASYFQKVIPKDIFGKIISISTAFAVICVPLGQVLFGFALDIFKNHIWFVILISAFFTLLTTMVVRNNTFFIKEDI
ncbi:MAG: MFS transporter, partial [Eubacteriales bacterium]|nr:MFS transporter [Eubacteriales bacterium]